MKKLYTLENLPLINHLKNILENNGIACVVKNLYSSGGAAEIPSAQCPPEIWLLYDSQYSEAEKLLNAYLQPSQLSKKPWKCKHCNEIIEPQFTQCWKCGSTHEE